MVQMPKHCLGDGPGLGFVLDKFGYGRLAADHIDQADVWNLQKVPREEVGEVCGLVNQYKRCFQKRCLKRGRAGTDEGKIAGRQYRGVFIPTRLYV